jgi:hypothetical protein
MALTEKGQYALTKIKQYFPKGQFNAKDLSDACGEKIVAATLNGVANNGYIIKHGGSPVMFEAVDGLDDLLTAALEEQSNKGCNNSNLRTAAKVKNDEFYTRYEDIEAEIMKYRKQFRNKIVYLPCDDPAEKKSEFWSFFVNNFDAFGLKKLIATHYDENGKAYKIWIDSDTTKDGYIDDADAMQEDLIGNGDFRSPECIEILQECDIVCTNPPFSLFRDFVNALITNNKQFLIIGNQNAFTYKEIFKLIRDNKIWTGYNMVHQFYQPDGSVKKFGNVCWFTNMNTSKRNEELVLTKLYNNIDYPTYDNYAAINVDKVVDIPKDYDGVMGVPITFIDKYNPNQFEIIDINPHFFTIVEQGLQKPDQLHLAKVGRKDPYARVLIKSK